MRPDVWWCYEMAALSRSLYTWHTWHLWHVWPVSRSRTMASVTRSAPGNLWSVTSQPGLLIPRDENRSQHTGHLLGTRAMMTLYSECIVFFTCHKPQNCDFNDLTKSWRESLATYGAFIGHPGDERNGQFLKNDDFMIFDQVVTRIARRIGWFIGHPVDDHHTFLRMSRFFFLKSQQTWIEWPGWGYLEPIRWPYHGSSPS